MFGQHQTSSFGIGFASKQRLDYTKFLISMLEAYCWIVLGTKLWNFTEQNLDSLQGIEYPLLAIATSYQYFLGAYVYFRD